MLRKCKKEDVDVFMKKEFEYSENVAYKVELLLINSDFLSHQESEEFLK